METREAPKSLTRQTLRVMRVDDETIVKYRYVCYHYRTNTFDNDATGLIQTDCLDCGASADTEMLISRNSVPLDTYYGPIQVEVMWRERRP